mmetsp:Transcript_5543/g.7761  ORF Transcript_5543/g.7761 Transcript_5543/m.7761 type:complete len:252 (+) Transcript_5543:1-756(+)
MNGHTDDLYDFDDDFQHHDEDEYQQTTIANNNDDENQNVIMDDNVSNDAMPQDFSHDLADEQLLETKQKLKAAMHYYVGKMAEYNQTSRNIPNHMTISKQTIASLNELVCSIAENLGRDVESFARHAKRSMVNTDDVKLCARRNPTILAKLNEYHVSIGGAEEKKPVQKRKRVSKKEKEQMEDVAAQMKNDSNDSVPDAVVNNPSNNTLQTDFSTTTASKPNNPSPTFGAANFGAFANTKGKLKLHKAIDD